MCVCVCVCARARVRTCVYSNVLSLYFKLVLQPNAYAWIHLKVYNKMHNIIYIYNLNTIDSHFYILFTFKKKIIRILLGIKCKLIIFLNYCEALFFFNDSFILDYLAFVLNNSFE